MWFKQIQVFHVTGSIPRNDEILEEQLEKMVFEPCRANIPMTAGWVAPIDEEKDNCPKPFYIEDTCILKDPTMANKVISFKGQDLFSDSIKAFLADGYKVEQIVINWQ